MHSPDSLNCFGPVNAIMLVVIVKDLSEDVSRVEIISSL